MKAFPKKKTEAWVAHTRFLAVSAATALLALTACKETTRLGGDGEDEEHGDVVLARHATLRGATGKEGLWAADAENLTKNANFYFRVFDDSFTRRFDDLPAKGEVPDDKKPMSGGYYPESTGGTDVVMVGGKSALQKYDDAFFPGAPKASAWERDKHTSGPAWAGHCNGFSAANQRHPKEPSLPVVRNGVTFDPKDVKALMAEVHMSADYEFLGGNRCENKTPPSVESRIATDATIMGDCEDINPGTLHAAITNWIGRRKHVLIMDQFAGDQVWNFPLIKYQVMSSQVISAEQAKQSVSAAGGATYIFNPTAVKFVFLTTRLTYVEAQKNEILGKRYTAEMDLTYILELNSTGEIVGGEWVGASQQDHPDFLWLALEPLPGNGTRYMGNPNLDPAEVIKMWAESAGFDPANPPIDIKRPPASTDWGKWAGFDVTLDGNKTGAVFGGKKTVLRIARRDNLATAGVSLDVGLNGSPLASLTAGAGEELSHAFDPGIGLNRLEFTWKKDGATLEDEFLRFHAVR